MLPAEAFVLGPRDALLILGLRVVRRAALVLLPVGVGVALASGISEDRLSTQFDTVSGWLQSLLSPLWLLAIAVLLRLAVVPVAYLAALGAALLGPCHVEVTPEGRSRWSVFGDRFRVAGGLRAFRWTVAARDVAVGLVGGVGTLLKRSEWLLGWAIWLAWALLVVGIAVTGG